MSEHKLSESQQLAVLVAWQAGQLSEGQAAEVLGVDRLTLRACRDMAVVEAVALWFEWKKLHPPQVPEKYKHLLVGWEQRIEEAARAALKEVPR